VLSGVDSIVSPRQPSALQVDPIPKFGEKVVSVSEAKDMEKTLL
jgi:hypothetical protein